MARRTRTALVLVLLSLAAQTGCGEAGPPASPSVRGLLLIVVDTLRADHVGAYGGPLVTPAMDRLAEEGVLLKEAVTPTPSTGPAHASLFTGLYPWRHGVLDNAVPMDERFSTLAEIARDRGFATAAFVSSYILHPRFGFDRGFERYSFAPTMGFEFLGRYREDFYARGESTTRAAMAWITEHVGRSEDPFFLWVHYFDPHAPYEPPPGFSVSPNDPVDLSNKSVAPGVRDLEDLEGKIRGYRGEVKYTDAQIGSLIERLRLLNVLDQVVVVLTSDHGEGLGDHDTLRHGENLFDELVRVPLVIRGPGLPAGRRLRGSAQLEDLLPTLLSLIGAPAPEGIDGVDLAPWLRGEVEQSPREFAVGRRRTYAGKPVLYFQRRWPEKWIGKIDEPGRAYALDRDAGELEGGVGAGAPSWLRSDVAREADSPLRPPDLDAEVRRALEALGYADSEPTD